MPPSRPTVRCCRAVQQHFPAPSDNVWITDGLLASAFERYCHVSRLTRRKSSSVPGPLENRRRLGKRRMAELHLDGHSTLPPWAIEFPVDLSQWKWQPPTLRISKEQRDLQSQQSQSLLSRVYRWSVSEQQMNEEEIARIDIESPPISTFEERLSQARAAVAASTQHAIGSEYYDFIEGLQRELKLGALDPSAVDSAVSTFPQSLISTRADGETVSIAIELFLSAVVNGIACSKVLGPSEFGASFWNLLLNRTSQMRANDATILLFQTTLDAVPRPYINDIHEGIIAAVQTLAVSQSTGRRRAADIGVALRELSPEDHGALLEGIETVVCRGSVVFEEETRQKLHFLWLQVLAHMPRVDSTYLFDACVRSQYFDRELPWHDDRDLSQLILQQWTSRGYLGDHKAVEAFWVRESSRHATSSLAALVAGICEIEHDKPKHLRREHVWLIKNLMKLLRRFGRQNQLVVSMQRFAEARDTIPIMPFARVASASHDYETALKLRSILLSREGKLEGRMGSQWPWTAWVPYIKSMIRDKSVPSWTIWSAVHCGDGKMNIYPAKQRDLWIRRISLMEDMAMWFASANTRSERSTFRDVSKCINWLRNNKVPLNSRSMTAIAKVATRELKRGEFGRTQRLVWLMDIIGQSKGPEQKALVARVLQRWRQANSELEIKRCREAERVPDAERIREAIRAPERSEW
ncbi:hypothetical protein CORC01_06882 [Colletotrichum orchidophilum]|uniref:Uncharacterized protein n=1 Tax=Colletotrichum orchidophilum TaxID=1209926 RepID=A0A1G4B8U9_9PEZI|nr:uncharacterized protein CORC01_06882 [Colletotrichum orchidophilum]OHE97847.1 hypothetical protein CORC01_06882 [Colletotrichum orchidophilum]